VRDPRPVFVERVCAPRGIRHDLLEGRFAAVSQVV
jgi:hypothetical protein